MFCGAYWSQRPESRAEAAGRIVRLLEGIRTIHKAFHVWLPKGAREGDAVEPIKITDDEIGRRLQVNRKDIGGAVMSELGFRLSLCNGEGASISITIGVTSPHVRNAVALSYKDGEPIDPNVWRGVLRAFADVMDPDTALVVAEDARLRRPRAPLWEIAWARYERGGAVVEELPP